MSLATLIEPWANRLYLQPEPAFGAASDAPVREFTGKTQFSYAPVQGQGGSRVGPYRLRLEQVSGVTHWQGSGSAEYQHGSLTVELFRLLFELVSEAPGSPSDGLTTYRFRLRRLAGLKTAKLGLEYEPTGPFYLLHGVAVDAIRLSATARSRAMLRFDFKARELEQVPLTRTYTHPPVTQYHQYNFLTETVGGPCYEDGASGLSCRVVSGDTVLATEDSYEIITEDGYAILLESERTQHEPQPSSAFTVLVNGQPMRATELSFEGREPKTPSRFNRDRRPDAMKPGPPAAGGELALYMNGDEVPFIVRQDSYASVRLSAAFSDGRSLSVELPMVKFGAGTPELAARSELVYRAPFAVLEAEESRLTLVV